jgi:hypothetical protein
MSLAVGMIVFGLNELSMNVNHICLMSKHAIAIILILVLAVQLL